MKQEAEFVLDASITMTWCFVDEASAYADTVLTRLGHASALTPGIWPLEVCNALAVAERRGRIDQAGVSRFLTALSALPILVQPERPERAFNNILALARQYALSSYDASYLDLAMRYGLPLATADTRLKEAAQAAGVAIYLNDD